ncbi:DUF4340 domain-containing protein [Treponema sp. HNW]|uniref:DUF4340 domain-containing protein n=1 Tax=unclassified Treponema TaxID=2638727 RepID=UPI003D0BBF4C
MNMLKLRKILLLSAAAVLALVYALQLIGERKNAVSDEALKLEADRIEVKLADGGFYALKKEGDAWLIESENEAGTAADTYAAREISDAVQKVRVLGKVGSIEDAERFGLDTAHAIEVRALKDGKELRTILVGKTAGTAMQTYAVLDKSQTVLLAAGDLQGTFSKKAENLKAAEQPPAEAHAEQGEAEREAPVTELETAEKQ